MAEYNPYDPVEDDYSVTKEVYTYYYPLDAGKFGHSDSIKFRISDQEANVVLSKSYLYIKGKICTADGTKLKATKLTNNAFMYLFDDVRYTMNGTETVYDKDLGHNTLIRHLATASPKEARQAQAYGLIPPGESPMNTDGITFDVSIPLAHIHNKFRDYTKLGTNQRHELQLNRSRTDHNCFQFTANETITKAEDARIIIEDMQWRVCQIDIANEFKAPMMANMNKRKPITVNWRQWEMHDNPNLLKTTPQTWSIKLTSQTERPRWVIFFLQTKRKDDINKDITKFDHCKLRSVRVSINNKFYPYEEHEIDFTHNYTSLLYDSYIQFLSSYHGEEPDPLLTRNDLVKNYPFFVVDCSKFPLPVISQTGAVDVKVILDAGANIPADTTAYCVLIYDKSVQYEPLSGSVNRVV